MQAIFAPTEPSVPPVPLVPAPVQTEPLDSTSFEEASAKAVPPAVTSQFVQVAFSARKFQRPQETEEQQLQLLAVRFDVLLSHAYECSSLGRLLKDKSEADRANLVAEALGGKALATLRKRLSSLTRMVRWCVTQGMSAFPLDSQVLLEYTGHLVRCGAPHSTFDACIEGCNFARFVLGVDALGEPQKHPVVQGRLRKVRFSRPPRVQARPFQVCEVAFLEAFVQDRARDVRDRYAAGVCLFCIHARARVWDVRAIKGMSTDFAEGEGYIECISVSHKCASAGNPLGLQLCLVAPERGVATGLWAKAWVETWKASGHPIATGDAALPLLQSPMVNGAWSGRRIPTGRFMTWISALLKSGDLSMGSGLTGHSCKHTGLSWAGKADFSKDLCSILGHHSLKDRHSVVTYSRDIQAGPLRELCQMYCDIRTGRYLPDMTRSGLYPKDVVPPDQGGHLEAGGALAGEELLWYRPAGSPARSSASAPDSSEPLQSFELVNESRLQPSHAGGDEDADCAPFPGSEGADSGDGDAGEASGDSSSSDSSSDSGSSDSELDEALTAFPADPPVGQRFHDRCPVYQQKSTKTFHLRPAGSSEERFICGREITTNHKPLTSAVQAAHWRCKQCWRGKPIRDLGSLVHCLEERMKKVPRAE